MSNIFYEYFEYFVPFCLIGILIILFSDVLGEWLDKLINGGKDENN
jgi:hypothetical protein